MLREPKIRHARTTCVLDIAQQVWQASFANGLVSHVSVNTLPISDLFVLFSLLTRLRTLQSDGWGPWTSAKGSTWSEQTGQPNKPFEYSAERSRGFTAPRFVRDAERLEYEKKYSPTEFRVRRVAIAAVFFGGVYTLWSWAYGGGLRRRRLGSVSRQSPVELSQAPTSARDIKPLSLSGAGTGAAAASPSSGVPATGLASVITLEGSRRQAASHKAAGDVMRANGDFAGAANAYREAALSAGIDKMFVEGRVGRLSEGGTEYHARMQRKQSPVASDASVVSESVQSQQQQQEPLHANVGNDDKLLQPQQQPPPPQQQQQRAIKGRARSGGLAAYKDSSERAYTSSHTKGTSAGRPGTVTAKGLANHVRDNTSTVPTPAQMLASLLHVRAFAHSCR